jgi:hypothetical protein
LLFASASFAAPPHHKHHRHHAAHHRAHPVQH